MPFKSIKNKINTMASGEILGNTEEELERSEREERQEKGASPKAPKKKKNREEKEKKPLGESFFKRKRAQEEEEDEEEYTPKQSQKVEPVKIKPKGAVTGYDEVLTLLGIKEVVNSGMDFESKDLDYIEFTQTTPIGFDFDEVTDFISRMKYILNKYENLLSQRDREIVMLASEVKKVENKMVEAKQASELEKMMGGMTEEERLIEENMDLRVELNKLKAKMTGNGNPEELERLNKKIELLQSENEVLNMKLKEQAKSNSSSNSSGLGGLPSFNQKEETTSSLPSFGALPSADIPIGEPDFISDSFMNSKPKQTFDPMEEMLKDIGGK